MKLKNGDGAMMKVLCGPQYSEPGELAQRELGLGQDRSGKRRVGDEFDALLFAQEGCVEAL
ncbi:MAG: hypothetical protein WD872_18970 [Pirellulaceae bacterium]